MPHAKNYSFPIDVGDEIRLAPVYDASSQLPFPDLIAQRLSMKTGDHYEFCSSEHGRLVEAGLRLHT